MPARSARRRLCAFELGDRRPGSLPDRPIPPVRRPGGMTSASTLAGCREVGSRSPLSADSLVGWRVAFESSAQVHDPDRTENSRISSPMITAAAGSGSTQPMRPIVAAASASKPERGFQKAAVATE